MLEQEAEQPPAFHPPAVITKPETRKRPTAYHAIFAREILDRLADGESLRSICRDEHLPKHGLVYGWVVDDLNDFGKHYARARKIGFLNKADEIEELADTCLPMADYIQKARLQIDTKKWNLARQYRQLFGEPSEAIDQREEPKRKEIVYRVTAPGERLNKQTFDDDEEEDD